MAKKITESTTKGSQSEHLPENPPDTSLHPLELALGQMSSALRNEASEFGRRLKPEQELHHALFLALYGSVQSVVGRGVLSTPLFGVGYDESTNRVQFKDFHGLAPVPKSGRHTITALDLLFACHARDLPLIFEGETGAGKTLLTESYLKAILPEECSVQMSLSQQAITDSPKEPFLVSEIMRGMPVTRIDWEKMRKIAAMYVDELNLGDTNDLLQLSYGRVLLSRERGVAGIPIPLLTEEGIKYNEVERLKRLWVSGSQNPPKTRDAQFAGVELPASLKNRFLVMRFPKIVRSAGSTMWLTDQDNGLHEKVREEFAARYLALTGNAFPQMGNPENGDRWLDVYAYTMDASRTEKVLIRSSLEFADSLILLLSGNLPEGYQSEQDIVEKWSPLLGMAHAALEDSLPETEEVKRLHKVTDAFDKPLTERDDRYLKQLADLFATVKALKQAYASPEPLKAYRAAPPYITVEDVAAAATLLAGNKLVNADEGAEPANAVQAVNAVLGTYLSLLDGLARVMNLKDYEGFRTTDDRLGIAYGIYTTSLREAVSVSQALGSMDGYIRMLKGLESGSSLRRMLIARSVADLATVAGFLQQHETEINSHLSAAGSSVEVSTAGTQGEGKAGDKAGARRLIREIYRRESAVPGFPEIYQHRLPRVI